MTDLSVLKAEQLEKEIAHTYHQALSLLEGLLTSGYRTACNLCTDLHLAHHCCDCPHFED